MTEAPELLRSAGALFWAWVPPAALQGGVALLVAWVVDVLLPRQAAPELREGVWALALFKLVLPPTLASPLSVASLLPAAVAARAGTPLGSDPVSWALPAAAAWVAGALAFLGFAALRSFRARRGLRRIRESASARDHAALDGAAARLGIRARPGLFRLPGAGSPFVLGAFRPAIYLPASVGEAELPHVLLHELAHVARRDSLRQGAARLLHALFWFHPLLPWARRRLAAAAEAACDRRVACALGQEASGYRACLLDFYRRAQVAPVGLPFLAPPTALRLRLEAIAGAGRQRSTSQRLGTAVLVCLLAAAFLPMAAVAERRSLEVAEWIARPPGCLQLRYLVLQRLAREATEAPPSTEPLR
ncbi:MAG TPA: M56 family metallopeptidase [Thermoanaerobaculia bacterium]|nr:M56 family metallopeptidase [Thermoanaerobaculia bacterium]